MKNELLTKIKQAQILAGEMAVIDSLKNKGLLADEGSVQRNKKQ